MSTILWILSVFHFVYISTRLGDNYLHCQLRLWSTAWSVPLLRSIIDPSPSVTTSSTETSKT